MKQLGINPKKSKPFIVLVCNVFVLLWNVSLIKYYLLIINYNHGCTYVNCMSMSAKKYY